VVALSIKDGFRVLDPGGAESARPGERSSGARRSAALVVFAFGIAIVGASLMIGSLVIGVFLAGVLVAGALIATVERRPLDTQDAALLGLLHLVSLVALTV